MSLPSVPSSPASNLAAFGVDISTTTEGFDCLLCRSSSDILKDLRVTLYLFHLKARGGQPNVVSVELLSENATGDQEVEGD